MKTLRQVKIGDTVKVKKLHGEGAVKRRIMDMALPRVWKYISAKWRRSAIRLKLLCADTSFRFAKRTPI